jgi:hypothetical protein
MDGHAGSVCSAFTVITGATLNLNWRTDMKPIYLRKTFLAVGAATILNLVLTAPAAAHCDSVDGPVISEAREALRNGDVTPLLKGVPEGDEATVKRAFADTRKVRELGPEAERIADAHFFETLVRVHRASEGAPFTGVKPAGGIEPAVQAADAALDSGEVDALVARITAAVERGIRDRYAAAHAARETSARSVEQGRAFVASYVQYVHYVENVHAAVAAADSHAHGAPVGDTHK